MVDNVLSDGRIQGIGTNSTRGKSSKLVWISNNITINTALGKASKVAMWEVLVKN